MSTLLIKRAHRALLLSMAAILTASMLAPMMAVANTDLVIGDTAIVSNAGGANLRSDITTVDDSTLIAELPEGATVYVQDGPFYTDTGVWAWVASDGYGPGYVSTDLLQKIGSDELAAANGISEEPVTEEAQVVSELSWLEPIDSLVVVDNNLELPEEGLAIRNAAGVDAPILGYAPVGTGLDVTSAREWVGDISFVRVNWGGAGAYVDGRFIALNSEAVVEEPVQEEVIWLDEEPVEEAPVEEAPVEEAPAEEAPVEEAPVDEAPVEEAPAEEIPAEEAPVATATAEETATEEAPVEEAPVEEAPAEEIPAEEAPAATATAEEAAIEEAPVEEAPVEEAPVATATAEETATEEVPVEEAPVEEAPIATATAEETATEEATTEPTVAPEQTVAATEVAAPVAPAPIASTADTFDAESMIGSATVTGTNNGLLCRAEPNPAAAVLMTLSEGTKVLVSAEPVNGYLGIDCGGLQGFADVNYLWSGGAGDEEITTSKMNLVVTGTGNGLNCRTGAGLSNSVITTVFDGTVLVTRGKASNGWTPVTCAGQNGFVSTTWVEVQAGSGNGSNNSGSTSGSAKVNTGGDGLYCRSGAGTSYGVITVLSHGSSVAVRGAKQGAWVPVTCGGSAGFAHGDFLSLGSTSTPAPTKPAPGAGTATGSVTVANTGGQGLNCRSGAGTGNSIITTLALGQSIQTRSGSTNGWTAVICGGSNGFVSSEFVSGGSAGTTPTKPAPTTPSGLVNGNHAKVTEALNLRYSGSQSASVVTVVNAGIVVKITGSVSNSYYPVSYDGLNGYMHKDYLTKTSAALSQRGGSGSPTTPAPKPPVTSTPTGGAMVDYAMRYLGYPYVWATHGPASFDCSGFTYWVTLNVTGKNIGAGTWTQVSAGTPVSKANLQPGDLVFFQNTYTAGLSHVGLYIGNGQFIHAQNEDTGVVISDLDSSYYGPRWYSAVRL